MMLSSKIWDLIMFIQKVYFASFKSPLAPSTFLAEIVYVLLLLHIIRGYVDRSRYQNNIII